LALQGKQELKKQKKQKEPFKQKGMPTKVEHPRKFHFRDKKNAAGKEQKEPFKPKEPNKRRRQRTKRTLKNP